MSTQLLLEEDLGSLHKTRLWAHNIIYFYYTNVRVFASVCVFLKAFVRLTLNTSILGIYFYTRITFIYKCT